MVAEAAVMGLMAVQVVLTQTLVELLPFQVLGSQPYQHLGELAVEAVIFILRLIQPIRTEMLLFMAPVVLEGQTLIRATALMLLHHLMAQVVAVEVAIFPTISLIAQGLQVKVVAHQPE